jgi:hypothetical protein
MSQRRSGANPRLHLITGLFVAFGLVGCGASSASDADDVATTAVPDTTAPDTTSVASTEPLATDPPTTDAIEPNLPDWASGEMVIVESDTGPRELPVELVPFCESSRSFYLAAKGLDYVEIGQTGTAQQLFAALVALVPSTIESAPSDDLAAQPMAARDQLVVLVPALEQIGYDDGRIEELPDPRAVLDNLAAFAETRDSLEDFLVEVCGADEDVLADQASGATSAAAAAAGETTEPDAPVEAVDGVAITNASSTIELSVPPDWTEIVDGLENGRQTLSASADLEGFFDLAAPGVVVLRGEGGFRDGGFVGRVLETQSLLEDAGCVLVDERFYFDNTYTGDERIFDCGNDGLDVRIFGGINEDESLYAMVVLVQPIDEPGIRQLILETFLVS